MKTKTIVYPVVILLAFIVPVAKYYTSTPEIDACMQVYIDNLEASESKWFIYDIDGRRHIEPANSSNNKALEQYLIWKADGCMMYSDQLLNDLNNMIYCAITFMIKKSPMHDSLKEPIVLKEKE